MRGLIAIVVVTSMAGVAAAQQSEADKLFEEARQLIADGKPAQACPKFEKSQELDPGRGTLINIAACYEAVGRLVDSLATFEEVLKESQAAKDQKRIDASTERIAALEKRIPHLSVMVEEQPPPEGFELRIAGKDVTGQTDVLVDPGSVEVVANADGREPWRTTVTISETQTVPVDVPVLQAAKPSGGSERPPPMRTVSVRDPKRQRFGLYVGAGGAVAFAGSVAIAFAARSKYTTALDAHCGGRADGCDATGLERTRSARTLGNLGTIVGVVGVAALAGGAILYLTAPKYDEHVPARVAPDLAPDHVGVSVFGTW